VDDLAVSARTYDFSVDPDWERVGANTSVMDTAIRPYHYVGHSETAHAGGADDGEIGGIVRRPEEADLEGAAYYVDVVTGLTFDTRQHAQGRVAMTRAGADSAVLVGWFDSWSYIGAPPRNFLGVMVEGPSRVGHYFRPAFRNDEGATALGQREPIMRPSPESCDWGIAYPPGCRDGLGRSPCRSEASASHCSCRTGFATPARRSTGSVSCLTGLVAPTSRSGWKT
jgi:hypothetical protein